jgi:ribosomal protein S18 acetylase RimI-like enzyme
LMGEVEAIGALLLHGVGPDDVLVIAPPETQSLLDCYYRVEHPTQMDRMRVTRQTFAPVPASEGSPLPQPLSPGSTQDMLNLILQAAKQDSRDLRDVAFMPEMVEGGHYFGIYLDGALIAMGGTHLIAPGARLAAVGNVVVHPSQRGRRLGTCISQAVTESLLNDAFDLIVLNVAHDNTPAVRTYERLGFRRVCGFVEGPAHRR